MRPLALAFRAVLAVLSLWRTWGRAPMARGSSPRHLPALPARVAPRRRLALSLSAPPAVGAPRRSSGARGQRDPPAGAGCRIVPACPAW